MDFAADTLPNEAEIALLTDAVALADAATRLERAVGTRAAADVLALSFIVIEESLYALGRCCRGAGDTLIPPGDPRERLATRFARASAQWPGANGLDRPSREQQARILTAFADTGAALQAAGAHCRRTHELIGATVPAADRIGNSRLLLGRAA